MRAYCLARISCRTPGIRWEGFSPLAVASRRGIQAMAKEDQTLETFLKSKRAQGWTELNCDKTKTQLVTTTDQEWIKTGANGVYRKMIERVGGEVARATTVVKFDPNRSFPEHDHEGGEEFVVLDGAWVDDFGRFPKYSYIRNYIGSRHTPSIPADGCTILVRLRQMAREETEPPHTCFDCAPDAPGWKRLADERQRLYVYSSRFERVTMERWPAGASADVLVPSGGREVFVVEGEFSDSLGRHDQWSWSRYASEGQSISMTAGSKGCYLYVKEGHLGSPEVGVDK
eukprot:TRINITY_DN31791_c0_g1_i1.p1 TRINITY_DN31791_c0_g1~~TRINITY_DN31791_c0_g1_i1.p1  ORF type:complete len:286 (-),score=38.78 TRINITY_DN31791_c0_g1_i1:76-933(-)